MTFACFLFQYLQCVRQVCTKENCILAPSSCSLQQLSYTHFTGKTILYVQQSHIFVAMLSPNIKIT